MRLRQDQYQIAVHPAKTKVLAAGRRWGKTVLGGICVMNCARQGGRAAWVVPEYRNGRPLWRMAEASIANLRKAKLVNVNEAERLITFQGGGSLGVYSADNPSSILGEAFNLVVVDEAARVKEEVWYETIQPTLADVAGDAILISTPKGRNWFWREWALGQDGQGHVKSWQCPSATNPNPNIRRAAELARDRVPERTYRQEWLAEFMEDGGGVFRRVSDAATATAQSAAQDGRRNVIGVDWGKSNDWTVLTVLDLGERAQAAIDRFNQIDYQVQIGRLRALCERFHPTVVIAERNSMGEPLIEQLQRMGLPVQPFLTTNATKTAAIDALALAFERGDLRILPDPVLVAELQAYEMERLPSGLLRYGAPAGMHDDCVMSLALAWQAVTNELTGKLFY